MTTVLTKEQRATVVANIGLVEHIVNRMTRQLPASYSRDDLVQSGIMGLIGATLRFDPEAGAAFSTFAGRRIEGAVLDTLRQADWAPRSVRAMERRLSREEERGQAEHGNLDPTALSDRLGLSQDELARLRSDIDQARLDSLDRRVVRNGHDQGPLSATVADQGASASEALDHQELLGHLREQIEQLSERQRLVIVGYFFEGRTMTELGELLGVSQSRASQLKEEALRALRADFRLFYDAEPDPGLQPRPGVVSKRRSDHRLVEGRGSG